MTAEYLTALASVGTFIVIAATAVLGLYQLRHLRAGNQLAEAVHITDQFRGDTIQGAIRFVRDTLPERLQDEKFRAELLGPDTDRRTHPELVIADLFEQTGSYIKYGMIDKEQFLDVAGSFVESLWEGTKPAIALRREGTGSSSMYENFEYLAVLAKDFRLAHPDGNYPRGVRRLMA